MLTVTLSLFMLTVTLSLYLYIVTVILLLYVDCHLVTLSLAHNSVILRNMLHYGECPHPLSSPPPRVAWCLCAAPSMG